MSVNRIKPFLIVAFVGAVAAMANRAIATTLTWDASGITPAAPQDGSGNWDTSSSLWSNGTTDTTWPNDGTGQAVFGFNGTGSGGTAGTVQVTTGIVTSGITFNTPAAGSYILADDGNNNSITLSTPNTGVPASGNITNSSTGASTITEKLTLAAGNHTIAGGAGGLGLNVAGGTLKTFGTGGVANFTGTVNTSTITNVDASTNGGSIIGGWATFGGTDFATVNAGAIVAYTGYTTVGAGAAINDGAATNVKITAAGTNTLTSAGTTNINSLLYGVNTADPITMTAGQTLRLGQFGGIFRPGNDNTAFSIGNAAGTGILTAGGSDNTAGEIVLNGGAGTGTGSELTINANITDNGTGVVTVIKTGRGYANIASTTGNTYSGGTFIDEGRFQAAGANSFGTGPITIQAGGEGLMSSGTWNNLFFIAGFGPQNENGNGAIRGGGTFANTVTLFGDAGVSGGGIYTGKITGPYSLQLGATANVGGGGSNLMLSNPNPNGSAGSNDWTGNTVITGRTGGTAGNTTVTLGASDQIPNGVNAGNLVMGVSNTTASTVTLNLNGFNETVNGLAIGTGTITPTLLTITNNSTTADSALTIGDNNATASYSGILKNATRKLSIVKIGSGVQTLSGTNAYTGNTTIMGGKLALISSTANNNIATSPSIIVGDNAANSSAILDVTGITTAGGFQVPSGQTLAGFGTVNGAVSALAGSFVGPGNSIGTLTENTSMALAGTLSIDLNDTDPGVVDVLKDLGNLDISAATSAVTFNVTGTPTAAAYVFANYGSLTGSAFGATNNLPAGYTLDYNYQGNNDIALVQAVPEPAALVLAVIGGVGLVLCRRRKLGD